MKRIAGKWIGGVLGVLLAAQMPAFADAPKPPPPPLHHESEAGIVVANGNSSTQTYNFKHSSTSEWGRNLLKLSGSYLKTSTRDLETARNWVLGLRYEREVFERFSAFAGQNVESDPFAGYMQRYNSDVGGKYFFIRDPAFQWSGEAGYRYSIENRREEQLNQSLLRFFTEAKNAWTSTLSTGISVEYLPNLTIHSDYQLNGELSAAANFSETFGLKLGYTLKHRKIPIPPAIQSTDTQFTTSLVAKY